MRLYRLSEDLPMNKILTTLTLLTLLFLSFGASADPVSPFEGLPSTMYENGTNVDVDDVISYELSCGPSARAYTTTFAVTVAFVNGGETLDVQDCVTQPGTYYFAFNASSAKYVSTSPFSNEMSRSFTAQEIGMIPMAPILISVGP